MTEESISIEQSNVKGKNLAKRIGIGLVAVAAIAGTYSTHEEDLPPAYVRKAGTSGGICVGGMINFEKDSKFYGSALSAINLNSGEINGVNISIANGGVGGKVNGLEAAVLFNVKTKKTESTRVNGVQLSLIANETNSGNAAQLSIGNIAENSNAFQLGLYNVATNSNAFQLGLCNVATNSNVLQIGLYNEARLPNNKVSRGILFNYAFGKKGEEDSPCELK